MNPTTESDAALLWGDVLDMLEEKDLAPSTLAMIKSCTPSELDEGTIHVMTNTRFVQRTVERNADVIEGCLERAAFEPMRVHVDLAQGEERKPVETNSEITREDFARWNTATEKTLPPTAGEVDAEMPTRDDTTSIIERRARNPLIEPITESDSKLTFGRFVEGEENMLAFQAAKQVADGENKNYNPLFIYGRSGLGKTHLLKAIQNYIVANDPTRLCIYKVSNDFVKDYVSAMLNTSKSAKEAFEQSYWDVDVLIIDDIQYLKGAAKSVEFFFNTFNYLTSHGKQIVLAADESPSQLGIGENGLDERLTSRLDSGVATPIQVPDYELKRALVKNFYERMKEDAVEENIPGCEGTISEENLQLMAEKSGANIRIIEGFCQSCLLTATRKEREGGSLQREDILRLANQKWPSGQKTITIEQIQKAVETDYGITHSDLVGSKRNKELMEPRHVAIWLTRELTDNTLADIGKKFGGRSHATVKHSISWVDDSKKADRVFFDRISRIREGLVEPLG